MAPISRVCPYSKTSVNGGWRGRERQARGRRLYCKGKAPNSFLFPPARPGDANQAPPASHPRAAPMTVQYRGRKVGERKRRVLDKTTAESREEQQFGARIDIGES